MTCHDRPAPFSLARPLAAIALAAALAGCGDSGGPSTLTANQMADRFDRIAGDYERRGDPETGAAMRGLGMLVRVTGRLSPVELTIDGARSRGWYALGVQERVPETPCPDDAPEWCEPLPADAARLVVAWQGGDARRVLIIIADTTGSDDYGFDFENPDFELPATAMYIDQPAQTLWMADSGTVTTAYRRSSEACPNDVQAPQGVEFTCARADFDVSTGMRAPEFDFDDMTPRVHRIQLGATNIAGLLIDITAWGDLALPGTGPDPFGGRFVPGLARALRR